ncbi:MAG: hypothetical protein ABIS36_05375 [Chryseolinea sp.]
MKLTSSGFKETAQIGELMSKMDDLNAEYVNSVSTELFQQQPFFLTVLLGYRLDLTHDELEEIMKIYFLVWEYFKAINNVPVKKVTEKEFEKVQTRHIEMLKYIEGEPDQQAKLNIYAHDIGKMKSKSLLAAVKFRYDTRPLLINMDGQTKTILFVGIKSFIECFEKN